MNPLLWSSRNKGFGGIAFAGVLFCAPEASADGALHACIVASDEGQRLRDDGALIEARDRFILCAQNACPTPIQKGCTQWLSETEGKLPSIVPAARDTTGVDVLDVRVAIDGVPVAGRLDGKAITVNPGPHRFRFEASGRSPLETTIVVREGEKHRVISITFEALASPAAATVGQQESPRVPALPATLGQQAPPRVPALSFVLAGASALAFGTFAYLGLSGQSDKNQLEETCASTRTCRLDEVEDVRTKLIAANVSLGVGVASLAAAALIVLLSPGGMSRSASSRLHFVSPSLRAAAVSGGVAF